MDKSYLSKLYLTDRRSVAEIAKQCHCSQSKINYWLKNYAIPKRSISDALYTKLNPSGDPFKEIAIDTIKKAFLKGLGLGLYWGEGNKNNKYSVRLGNTNPKLVKKFIEFLVNIYNIDISKLRFGLQLFNDSNPDHSLKFWCQNLNVSQKFFQKVVVSNIRGKGTYKIKSNHGVITVHFNNKRLRNIICNEIENL